jgi:hypothetical protein
VTLGPKDITVMNREVFGLSRDVGHSKYTGCGDLRDPVDDIQPWDLLSNTVTIQ